MLVLSRKPGERIHVGRGIVITVLGASGNRVHVGVTAPEDLRILRGELVVDPDDLAPWEEPVGAEVQAVQRS